ncbi:hypothetical protein ODR60_02545, partial [Escherichia coli]|uniref:hypothetical protein n=1 Tax=Escherichia coli TaxID=562 RepID=UPI00385BA9F9
WKGWAILLRQKQKKLIMLPSETMIWQPEFTDKTLSRKPGAVHGQREKSEGKRIHRTFEQNTRNATRTLPGNANQQQPQNLQLNHTTQSRMRMTRLKPVYR